MIKLNPKLFEKDTVLTVISFPDVVFKMVVKVTGEKSIGRPIFKLYRRGERKKFVINGLYSQKTLIFEGNDLPFEIYEATKNMPARINSQLNLLGKPKVIKHWIKCKNLNPYFNKFEKISQVSKSGRARRLFSK